MGESEGRKVEGQKRKSGLQGGDELGDDLLGGDALAGGVVVGDDAVAEDGQCDGADLVDGGGRVHAQQGKGAGGAGEALGGARAGTVGDVVLDVFRDIATVKVYSFPYMDYLHLVKINDHWSILNCLYEVRVGEQTFA